MSVTLSLDGISNEKHSFEDLDLHPCPRERDELVQWARNLTQNPGSWVILDTETTGVRKSDEIIEITIIDGWGNILLDTLVKPKRRTIPKESLAIHGITNEMVKDAPRFPEILPRIEAAVRGKRVLMYNAEFDFRLLYQSYKKYYDDNPGWKWQASCVMLAYSGFVGEMSPYFKGQYAYQKLPSASHRCLGDCQATLAVIRKMAKTEVGVYAVPIKSREMSVGSINSGPEPVESFIIKSNGSLKSGIDWSLIAYSIASLVFFIWLCFLLPKYVR